MLRGPARSANDARRNRPPGRPKAGSWLEQCFLRACALDVAVLKPGNVSLASPGHGMTAAQFLSSAAAAAPAVCRRGAPVGERILAAVEATRAVAGCNTNLGIVLLCAPIAAALQSTAGQWTGDRPGAAALRRALQSVLDGLTVADARAAYRAIVLANPGGLGTSPEQDVHCDPTLDLRAAMSLARERDRVARQYATGYADVFDVGLCEWQAALGNAVGTRAGDADMPGSEAADASRSDGEDLHEPMQRVFLAYLSRFPDSHIVRKQGLSAAQSVTQQAQYWRTRRSGAACDQAGLARWDEALKAAGLNPGTSADLSVATAFIACAARPAFPGVAMAR
jgi:triphosphoribosyl-dephospho-CoA synthase